MQKILLQSTKRQVDEPLGAPYCCHSGHICWRLKSRLFMKSCLFKGHRVQQGSNREEFLCVDRKDFLCESNKSLKVVQIPLNRSVFLLKITADLFENLVLTFSAQLSFQSV
jgi:hypothetical protein